MSMRDIKCKVLSNKNVAKDIYQMELTADRVDDIVGGMFVNIKIPSNEMLLRRPLCLCDFNEEKNSFTVCYAVVGEGTKVLSTIKEGAELDCMLPLGNGFFPKENYKKILLIGGGMGAAVLPAVARRFKDIEFVSYLGFANKDKVILEDELKNLCSKVVVATDNGTYGEAGFVTNIVKRDLDKLNVDAIFCCGPEVMFRALAKTLEGMDVPPIYVSLEARMGCGIGACLVCNCKIKRNGEEGYYRVCKDGPVFPLEEVVL